MPFDIQLKGFLIGLLFAYFIIPYVQSWITRSRKPAANAA